MFSFGRTWAKSQGTAQPLQPMAPPRPQSSSLSSPTVRYSLCILHV